MTARAGPRKAFALKLGAAIRAARERAGKSQQDVADHFGRKRQTIGAWETGVSIPDSMTLRELAVLLKTTEAGLLRNDRALARDVLAVHEDDTGLGEFGQVRQIPVISWVAASAYAGSADPYPVGQGDRTVAAVNVGPRCFALRVQGPSMEPEFRHGSIIVVDPEREPKNGDHVVVRLNGSDEATFKQLHLEGGKRWLRPLNPQFPAFEMVGNAQFCGVVVRQLKEY